MLEGKIIFLTGGAGFIGATLIGRLIDTNRIVVFDNFSRDSLSERSWASHPNLTVLRGDVLDGAALSKAIDDARPNLIVHLAAIAGIDTVIKKPVSTMRVNMIGSANVLDAAAGLTR
jgi:UDP-glucose 4-epimerase